MEIVRDLFERWNRGDYTKIEWADPDIEFVMQTPGGGSWRGIDEMRTAWLDFLKVWQGFSGEPEEIIDVGDQVLALNRFGGRGRESGVPIRDMQGAALFRFEGDRVVRLVLFGNQGEAREAAGLSESDA